MQVEKLKEAMELVHRYFPNAHSYMKKFYYYVVGDNFPGFTIGSGESRAEAWEMAAQAVKEWAEAQGKEAHI